MQVTPRHNSNAAILAPDSHRFAAFIQKVMSEIWFARIAFAVSAPNDVRMSLLPPGPRRGRSALVGVAVGITVGAGLAASPEYLDDPRLGIALGAVGGLVAFAVGLWWEQHRQRLLDRQERLAQWRAVFMSRPADGIAIESGLAKLLSPYAGTVPFERDHLKQVTQIRRWCTDNQPGIVWLIAGGPGTGKTRLVLRVAENLQNREQSWDVGWVSPGQGKAVAAVAVAASWHRPVLMVVDDADLRDDLGDLLTALHQHEQDQDRPVKLLLVSREFGGWWFDVKESMRVSVDSALDHTWMGPLASTVAGQRAAAGRAFAAFAKALHADNTVTATGVAGLTAVTPALDLHTAALLSVDNALNEISEPIDVSDAVSEIIDIERELWWREAARQDLNQVAGITEDTLQNTLVLSALVGARNKPEAELLLRRLPNLRTAETDIIRRLVIWSRRYGLVVGYYVRPHLPAAMAEHMVASALAADPDLAAVVVEACDSPVQTRYALAVVIRAARHTVAAQAAVRKMLLADPHRLLPEAIRMAAAGIGPIDGAIADTASQADLDWNTAGSLIQMLVDRKALTRTGVALAEIRCRRAPNKRERARAMCEYSEQLRRNGRNAAALDAARGAVKLCRQLRRVLADYGDSLPGFALLALAEASGWPAGIEPAEQAISFFRDEAPNPSETYLADLANAFAVLARIIYGANANGIPLGLMAALPPQAIPPADNAAVLYGKLVDADPKRFLPRYGEAVEQLANSLHAVGRERDAVAVAKRAVAVYRTLPADGLEAHQGSLASALNTLAICAHSAGEKGYLISAQESVAEYRRLSNNNPGPHRKSLAGALSTFGMMLDASGRIAEGAAARKESELLFRSLHAEDEHDPGSSLPASPRSEVSLETNAEYDVPQATITFSADDATASALDRLANARYEADDE